MIIESCTDLFRINGIRERDIDLLFLEEFISSSSFRTFFLEKTDRSPVLQFIKAEVSVVDDNDRESDLVVWFKDNSETKLVFLIENKIGALMQEKQADDYHKRGGQIVEEGDADDYITVLAAPKNYKSEQAGIFNYRIDYEDIHEWFKSSAFSDDRKSYKLSLVQSAIDKQGKQPTFQVKHTSETVTEFWQDYWNFVVDHAPEFQMKKPSIAGKGTTYREFRCASGLPGGMLKITGEPIHPGEFLADELEEIQITATDLAHRIKVPANRISEIVRGKRDISADAALRLGRFFGTGPELWLNLQKAYDLEQAKTSLEKDIGKIQRWQPEVRTAG